MTLKRKPKEEMPLRKHPGDPEAERCAPGSIEQELDMCDEGSLRGDEILHHHGRTRRDDREEPLPLDQVLEDNFQMDLSEPNREGIEMTGDDHSLGLQGGEAEIAGQPHIRTGMPGDFTEDLGRARTALRDEEGISQIPAKTLSKKRARRKAA